MPRTDSCGGRGGGDAVLLSYGVDNRHNGRLRDGIGNPLPLEGAWDGCLGCGGYLRWDGALCIHQGQGVLCGHLALGGHPRWAAAGDVRPTWGVRHVWAAVDDVLGQCVCQYHDVVGQGVWMDLDALAGDLGWLLPLGLGLWSPHRIAARARCLAAYLCGRDAVWGAWDAEPLGMGLVVVFLVVELYKKILQEALSG